MFFRRSKPEQTEKYIIVGAGEVGFHIAQRLVQESRDVVVIDKSQEKLRRIESQLDAQTVQGNGASPEVLKLAGAESASAVLAVTDSDEINILVCLFANAISPKASKLARLRNSAYTDYPDLLGSAAVNISLLVNPEVEVVRTIERLITLPGALEYGQFVEGRIRMVAMRMENCSLVGTMLKDFRSIVHEDGIMVGAIARGDSLIIPSGNDSMEAGDVVYFIYTHDNQGALLRALGRTRSTIRSACIVGGGNIGARLAKRLEDKGIDVKLIDSSEARCETLAAELDSTLVLYGDGTDSVLLNAERIENLDAFIAVTGDQESNILSCLLAQSLGVRETVARIDKVAYVPLAETIGIRHSVSPRLASVNSILQYIRAGQVLSILSVGRDAAEVLEVLVPPTAKMAGCLLRELRLPRGALLIGVVRGGTPFIPTGESRIEAGDRVVALCLRAVVAQAERILAANKE